MWLTIHIKYGVAGESIINRIRQQVILHQGAGKKVLFFVVDNGKDYSVLICAEGETASSLDRFINRWATACPDLIDQVQEEVVV